MAHERRFARARQAHDAKDFAACDVEAGRLYANDTAEAFKHLGWGAEKAYQRDFFNGRYIGADTSSPPFEKLAELDGAKGYRADTLSQTADAMEAALTCGKPAVIDVIVDPAALYSFCRDSFKHRGG